MSRTSRCAWAPNAAAERPCLCDSVASLARITPRRAALLTLIAGWRTNEEIAAELRVRTATVKRHVEVLRSLTGCRSKGQLALWWTAHEPGWRSTLGRL